jgi:type II secretion system protein D
MFARRSISLLLALLLLLPALAGRAQQTTKTEEVTTIQLPANPVSDFAAYYQSITGKQVVADATVMTGGQNLTLVVPQSVTKQEAAELIKSVLVLNGFTLVDVDANTVKLLGPSKFPRSESVPLYTDPSQLPPGDEVVSYFMPLRYLKSDEAAAAFANYAPFRPFGSVVQVPSVNAIVITETATFVRRLIELKDVIDVEGARTATKFFPLVRADAENIVEILSKLFEKPDGAISVGSAPQARPPTQPGQPAVPASPVATLSGPAQKVQVFAVKRTNTVMVVAPEEQMPYIKDLIDNLDSEMNFDQPLEQPLRFVKAGDVLPVLANMLAEGEDKKNGGTPQIAGADNNNSNQSNANGNNSNNGNSSYNGSGGSGGSLSVDNSTSFNVESSTPQSVTVGNARIIADRSVNKIIVIGPPESKLKAKQVLEMLDQRPKQVYLAVVIGQLTLGKNLEYGINYLYKGTNPEAGFIRALGTGSTGDIANLIKSRNGTLDVVPDTSTVTNTAVNAATSAIPILSGLTVYGSIANSVDILARAMAATNKFQIISRPVVYTANGQAAKISSGTSVPVASGTLTSAIDTNSNSNNLGSSIASNVEYKDIVLELEVQPLINSDHEVTLRIKQKNDTIQGTTTVSGNSYPTLGVQGLNTTITVPNRNTVVLGGLISEQDDLTQTGIPLLKDIPYVGALFGSTVKNKTRRELIIMIQPFIVDTDEKLAEVNYIERANTGFKGEHLFDQPVPIQKATLPPPEDLTNPRLR